MMAIILRALTPDDYLPLYQITQNPQVIWGTMRVPFQRIEQARRWFESLDDNDYILVACTADGEVLGSCGLHINSNPRSRHIAELGIAIHDDWQGKGVGSQLMTAVIDLADNWLNLKRLGLEVWTDNAPAIALYKKFGFEIEGTHRAVAFRAGRYIDTYSMARLREG
ncbi:MAG: GNAT family N-acetyltransferase [Chloroflexaceae bacterium]|nr:GNAT family N-acetyltransferase [Chloroflexaceae bacterium]